MVSDDPVTLFFSTVHDDKQHYSEPRRSHLDTPNLHQIPVLFTIPRPPLYPNVRTRPASKRRHLSERQLAARICLPGTTLSDTTTGPYNNYNLGHSFSRLIPLFHVYNTRTSVVQHRGTQVALTRRTSLFTANVCITSIRAVQRRRSRSASESAWYAGRGHLLPTDANWTAAACVLWAFPICPAAFLRPTIGRGIERNRALDLTMRDALCVGVRQRYRLIGLCTDIALCCLFALRVRASVMLCGISCVYNWNERAFRLMLQQHRCDVDIMEILFVISGFFVGLTR